ncbi:MAG: tetratricopeptide repeat protein [Caldilineaceae bacterium]|nr:tetratricopeptide repeat protein [Caldilineaceae bacterium]
MTLPSPAHFTDREDALAAYDALWQPGGSQRVLNIEGMSGNGKSTLLWFLDNHHPRPAARLHLRLDMESASVRQGDYELLDALAHQCRPCLDAGALAAYAARKDVALAQAQAIRAAPAEARIEQHVADGSSVAASPNSITFEVATRLADLRRQARTDLLWELCDALAGLAALEMTLFVDSYEYVRHGADAEFRAWFEEQVLEALLQTLPHLRVVVAGREELPFRADRHQRATLRLWTAGESDRFLQSYAIDDPSLLAAIYAHCQGHPLLTNLAREVWSAGADVGRPLTPDELRADINRAAAAQWLVSRLLERLPEKLRAAVRAAALLRELSLDALNAVLDAGDALTTAEYQRLLRFSFVIAPPGQPPRVHDLIRQTEEAWNRTHEPARHQALHALAQAYYAQLGDGAGVDTLYHHLALDTDAAFARWKDEMGDALFNFDRQAQQALLEVARLPERWAELNDQQRGDWHYLRGRSEYYSDQWHAALDDYAEALGLFRAVGDRLGEANVLKAQGDVLYFLKRTDEALEKYAEALGLFRAVGDRLGEANVLKAQGDVLYFLKRTDEALEKYAEALGLFRAVGDRLGEANVLKAQGDVLYFLKRTDEALEKYAEALGLFRAVGDRLGEANVLQAQGDVHRWKREYDSARAMYESALNLYLQVGARQGTANAYLGLGRTALAEGSGAEAVQWTQRAIDIHASNQSRYDVALDCQTLAEAYKVIDRPEDAIEALRRSILLYAEIDLIDWANSVRTSLGNLLEELGRVEESLNVYGEAVSAQPEAAWLRRNYAEGLTKSQRLAEAAEQLDRAEELQPDAPYLALRRAELAQAQGDRTQAAAWASEALRRQPDWDEAQALLAWATSLDDEAAAHDG